MTSLRRRAGGRLNKKNDIDPWDKPKGFRIGILTPDKSFDSALRTIVGLDVF